MCWEVYAGTNLKLTMEVVNPEVTIEISLPDIVDPTSEIPDLNKINNEFSLSDSNSHDGFVQDVVDGAYTGTNLKLETEEEVKLKVTSEVWLPAIFESTSHAPHLNEIKKELSLSEPNSHDDFVEHVVKLEDTSIESLDLKIKSEVPDLECDIESVNDSVYIKIEHSMSEDVYIQDEIGESHMDETIQKSSQLEHFYCSLCSSKFTHKGNLQRHVNNHTKEKSFRCNICDYKCKDKSNLQRHIKSHTGEKPFKCSICDCRCTRKSHLQQHMKTHEGEKQFQCNICDCRFIQKSGLSRHMKIHTGERRYKCGVCNYRCRQNSTLRTHMMTHTGEKPYKCSLCDYRARQNSTLQAHMITHTGEKPYKCSVCFYRAGQRSTLQTHMITHTAEKAFHCKTPIGE